MRSGNTPTSMLWSGRILSGLVAAALLLSGVMKFVKPPSLNEGFAHLGWPVRYAVPLGILEVSCTVLYLIPRTAVLGAVLLAGYMGGAIATHPAWVIRSSRRSCSACSRGSACTFATPASAPCSRSRPDSSRAAL